MLLYYHKMPKISRVFIPPGRCYNDLSFELRRGIYGQKLDGFIAKHKSIIQGDGNEPVYRGIWAYIDRNNYVETIIRLQDIFYLYKNEMNDEITDDELLHLMKEQFEILCFGDLDYLETNCLADFARAIRAGYEGYKETDGYGEYAGFDVQERWSYELYQEALKELCWG